MEKDLKRERRDTPEGMKKMKIETVPETPPAKVMPCPSTGSLPTPTFPKDVEAMRAGRHDLSDEITPGRVSTRKHRKRSIRENNNVSTISNFNTSMNAAMEET